LSTDFRALCAELLEALENAIRVIYREDGTKHISTADAVIAKADAALAQPEPVGPTDEELDELWTEIDGGGAIWAWEPYARAVLARWGRPALAQPEPVGPTDEEIDALVICIQGLPVPDADDLALPSIDRGREIVRKAIARWGRPAITPIPVSERLPGPEDCDAEGRCWLLTDCLSSTHWLPASALSLPEGSIPSPQQDATDAGSLPHL
jgi:hypothetical protein